MCTKKQKKNRQTFYWKRHSSLSTNNDEVTVDFLKQLTDDKFIWPDIEDKYDVIVENIKTVLENPNLFGRALFQRWFIFI